MSHIIDQHEEIERELKNAKRLTQNLKMRQTMDYVLISLALLFYVTVCAYIIVSRVKMGIASVSDWTWWLFGWMVPSSFLSDELQADL